MSDPAIQPDAVDAAQFARSVATTPDEQLAQGMASELRGQILDEIFRRMAEHFDPSNAAGTDAVIHWKITGRPDGGADHYEVVIRDGACTVSETPDQHPRVTFTIGGVDFLKLVTGNVGGPALFMQGRIKIDGDLMFAAGAAGLFRMPG